VAWRDGYHAIPRTDVGTEGEAQVLPPWCDQHQFRSIVFVAARDHSRRLRRVLDRVMKGPRIRVTVRPARHSNFDPTDGGKLTMASEQGSSSSRSSCSRPFCMQYHFLHRVFRMECLESCLIGRMRLSEMSHACKMESAPVLRIRRTPRAHRGPSDRRGGRGPQARSKNPTN
jgi:hypothetical protein